MTHQAVCAGSTCADCWPTHKPALPAPRPCCCVCLQVTSGQLAALGLPVAAMNLDASKLIDTYGKTWHFWQVDLGHELPMGECGQSVRV